MRTRIIVISDTHGSHEDLTHSLPYGEILIHCGDFCNRGDAVEALTFMDWFAKLPYQHKIFISGNHDCCMEVASRTEVARWLDRNTVGNIHYLEDSGVTVEGIKFWGSPVQPEFCNWAFNRTPENIEKHWDAIPVDTDFLITHGPRFGVLDQCPRAWNSDELHHVGCPVLDRVLTEKGIKPKVHAFGHIHYSYGSQVYVDPQTKHHSYSLNASVMSEQYIPSNKPHVLDWDGTQFNQIYVR